MVCVYCFDHAMEEMALQEYFDTHSKLGHYVCTIPAENVRSHKCYGVRGNKCNKWGKFAVLLVNKKDAFISTQDVFEGSPLNTKEEVQDAKKLAIFDKDVAVAIKRRYKKVDRYRRLDKLSPKLLLKVRQK